MAEQDRSYKQLFSHPELVADLLRGFVREDWVAQLDLSTLEKVSASYVSDDLREREGDVVWRVRWGSDWVYVYVLIEFQSAIDRFMAVRLLTYVGLLYQDLIRQRELLRAGRLPPVLPVVLYNGTPRWSAAEDVAELIARPPGKLARYQPSMRYLVLDQGAYSTAELAPLDNLATALFRLENSESADDVVAVVAALLRWLEGPDHASLRRAFTVWLARVLLPKRLPGVTMAEATDLEEVHTMLSERVEEWTRPWREEGRKEGELLLLRRLMEKRFGPLPAWAAQRLEQASPGEVELWAERVLDVDTLEALFAEP